MIGGIRFALARARAALPPLVALAVVAAVAGALIAGVAGSVRAAEAREVRAALAAAPGDLGRLVVDVRGGGSAEKVAGAIEDLVTDAGAAASVHVTVDGADVVIAPDLALISSTQLPALADVLTASAIERASGADVQVAGSLDRTLAAIDASVALRRGPTAVALGVLGVIAAVVVGAVATESARVRRGENHLLRARGARRRSLFRGAALESLVVALVGAVVGVAAGALASSAIGGVGVDAVVAGTAALAIAVVAGGVAAIATIRGVDQRGSRARAVADIGVAVVLAVLTGVAAWRFAQSGTPVITRGDGGSALDPLVAVAPALVLAFAALVAVVVATPLARAVAVVLSRTRGVVPLTPLRLASRRPARHALSIVVVAFAIGAIGVAGAYQGSLAALGDAPEELRVGADVRVGTIPVDVDTAEVAAVQPSTAAMRARPMSAEIADGRVPVLAVEAGRLAAVLRDAGSTVDPAALSDLLALDDPGVALAGDSVTLTVTAPVPDALVVGGEEVQGLPAPVYGRVTLIGPDGATTAMEFANFDVPEATEDGGAVSAPAAPVEDRITLDLPDGGPWRLGGLDVAAYPYWAWEPEAVLSAVESGGAAVDLSGFRPVTGTDGDVESADGALVFHPSIDAGGGNPWTRSVGPGIPHPVPAVVTAGVAAELSLAVDEPFSLEMVSPGFDADFVVAGIVDVLPGTATGEGLLVDLAALGFASPVDIVPNQVWMSSDEPARLALAVGEAFPQTVTTVADPLAAQNAGATAIGFVLAAAGAVVLAIVVLVLRRTRSRADSRELAQLAVMGLGRSGAARLRAIEDLFAVVIGVAGGLAAGAATAWLVVPPLVRAAYGSIPAAFPVPLEVSPLALTGAVAVAAVAFGIIAATVRAPSRLAALLREDE